MSRTFDIPNTIPMSKIRAFLADLGIDATHLRELNIGMDGVHVELASRDEQGRPFCAPNGDLAVDQIAIRLDRDA